MKYLKKFNTENDRSAYENGESYIEPYVSYVDGGDVHYNKPPFFCRLTLSDDSVVEIEGSGELTQAMTSGYSTTCVGAEVGELCTSIGNNAFNLFKELASIVISDSVTIIDWEAFRLCTKLTDITMGNSITYIGDFAFYYCSGLTSIIIPDSVTTVSRNAFYSCESLITMTIPSGVTSLGNNVFQNCNSLTSITSLATTAPTIDSYTFNGISRNGTLYVPQGSTGYDVWMYKSSGGYLGYYDWTLVEQ